MYISVASYVLQYHVLDCMINEYVNKGRYLLTQRMTQLYMFTFPAVSCFIIRLQSHCQIPAWHNKTDSQN